MDKNEWCIVKYHNTSPERKTEYDLLVRRVYQWEALEWQVKNGKAKIVARGFKSNDEALFYLPLYND